MRYLILIFTSMTIAVGQIVINEIHYNPDDAAGYSDENYEFIELYNIGSTNVSLNGYFIEGSIGHIFSANDSIVSGEFLILARNGDTFTGALQWDSGSLVDTGDTLKIFTADSLLVDSVYYQNDGDWPTEPDGNGPSLELINPALDNSDPASWRASFIINGTPGDTNSTPPADIIITPDSLYQSLYSGETASQVLTITNYDSVDVILSVSIADQTNALRLPIEDISRRLKGVGFFTPQPAIVPDLNRTGSKILFQDATGTTRQGIRCATPSPPLSETIRSYEAMQRYNARREERTNRDQITVLVAFHIIHAVDGTGDVTDQMINDQIDVLNEAYADYGFVFNLDVIDRTANDNWFYDIDSYENQAKQALAVDPVHYLNIYTAQPQGGILGWAWLPVSWPENSYMHGVVLLYSTLPGGTAYPYHLGDTGTHEAGHYLGLLHTFENGCSYPGDAVDDTPYEAEPAYACNERDTCPNDPGNDPIHNFMDYTDDVCLYEFTSGQNERMVAQINQFRPGLLENSPFPSWISADTESITVGAGQSGNVLISFDATELFGGDYRAEIQFTSDNTEIADITVPVHLDVTGIPDISIAVDTVDFGPVFVNYSDSSDLVVTNDGTDTLLITYVLIEPSIFTVTPNSGEIPPGDDMTFHIYFTPTGVSLFNGTISFISNDPDSNLYVLHLTGEGMNPPEILLTEDSFSTALESGESDTLLLDIINNGGSNLNYSIVLNDSTDGLRFAVVNSARYLSPTSKRNILFEQEKTPKYSWESKQSNSVREVIMTLLSTDFENGIPGEWSDPSNFWQSGDATGGSSQYFQIPEYTQFAYINDDGLGSDGPAVDAYLATPSIDCSGFSDISLSFTSYYPVANDGEFSNFAEVLISVNNEEWETLSTDPVAAQWNELFFDISDYADGNSIRIGFHFSDLGGNWSYGWCIDDVVLVGANANLSWITVNPVSGTIAAGDTGQVQVNISSAGLEAGEHMAEISIHSNDPVTPVVNVPVTLLVSGPPVLAMEQEFVDFGTSYLGVADSTFLRLANAGAVELNLSHFTSPDPRLTLWPASITIPAFGLDSLTLILMADTTDTFSTTISFTTNDPVAAVVEVPVRSFVMLPPEIQISDQTITLSNGVETFVMDTLVIFNAGGSELLYSTQIVYQDNTEETILIDENFSPCSLPGNWTVSTNSSIGWSFGSDASSEYWTVLVGDGCYAFSNDDTANDDGSLDYLITPVLDLTSITGLTLSFDSYFTGSYSQQAFLEISLDNGVSWSPVSEIEAFDTWQTIQIDLSDYAGLDNVILGFHSDDNGEWASGWAVDNVKLIAVSVNEWLLITLATGMIITNGQSDLILVADATDLPTGSYSAILNILNNDPFNPVASTSIQFDVTSLGIMTAANLPDVYSLHQNFPNPFNPLTTIQYDLPKRTIVKIIIYDIQGRQVKTLVDQEIGAGYQSIRWNSENDFGKKVSTGLYFYRLDTSEFTKTNKMIILK